MCMKPRPLATVQLLEAIAHEKRMTSKKLKSECVCVCVCW